MIVGVMWVNLKTWSRNVWHFWHFTHPFPSLTTWPSSSGACIVQFIILGIYVAIKTIKNYCKIIQKLTFLAKCPILFTFSQAILAILSYIRGICFTCPLGGGVDKYLTRPRKFKLHRDKHGRMWNSSHTAYFHLHISVYKTHKLRSKSQQFVKHYNKNKWKRQIFKKKISFSSVDLENAFCLKDSTQLIYVPVPLYSNT